MVNPCVACIAVLGIGCSMASGIWWIVDFNWFNDVVIVAAIIMSGVAIFCALCGLCFGTCLESCTCLGKTSSAMLLMAAFGCQCVTLISLSIRPKCVFSGCEVGGATIVSICGMILYFMSGIAACVMPTGDNRENNE